MIREFKVERLDSSQTLPFPPRSVVSTPGDATSWKVLAVGSDGAERVLEAIDGPRAGARKLVNPTEVRLTLVAAAPPIEPEQPILCKPSGGSRIRDDNHNVTVVPGPPTVVAVDFVPEMFANPVLGPAVIRLENGPYDGVIAKLPRMSAEYEVPAANPDQGAASRAMSRRSTRGPAPRPGRRPGRVRLRQVSVTGLRVPSVLKLLGLPSLRLGRLPGSLVKPAVPSRVRPGGSPANQVATVRRPQVADDESDSEENTPDDPVSKPPIMRCPMLISPLKEVRSLD